MVLVLSGSSAGMVVMRSKGCVACREEKVNSRRICVPWMCSGSTPVFLRTWYELDDPKGRVSTPTKEALPSSHFTFLTAQTSATTSTPPQAFLLRTQSTQMKPTHSYTSHTPSSSSAASPSCGPRQQPAASFQRRARTLAKSTTVLRAFTDTFDATDQSNRCLRSTRAQGAS